MYQAQNMEQKQILTAQLLQSLNVLAMNNSELSEFVNDEYSNNPLLEISDKSDKNENFVSMGTWLKSGATKITKNTSSSLDDDKNEFDIPDIADCSLKDNLKSQLYHKDYSDYEWSLIDSILDFIDDSGYLTTSVEEISIITSSPVYDVVKCISVIQGLEPAGVGASNLAECLILQLKRKGIFDPNFEIILKNYLNDIAVGHFNKISKDLGISKSKIKSYVLNIKSLDPKPCRSFGNCKCQYIVPDIIIKFENKKWEAKINDMWDGSIGISHLYSKYLNNAGSAEVSLYLEEKIKRAKFVLNCIEQRRETLYKLANYIIEHQSEFLTQHGGLMPMMPSKVAADIGLHPSTISRAIKDKYIQTPSGNYPFKFFFEKEVKHTEDIVEASSTLSKSSTKDLIRKLAFSNGENKPLSDSKIATLLSENGINISRRTVAKYREEMGISNTYDRQCALAH